METLAKFVEKAKTIQQHEYVEDTWNEKRTDAQRRNFISGKLASMAVPAEVTLEVLLDEEL